MTTRIDSFRPHFAALDPGLACFSLDTGNCGNLEGAR
jgi:hypothetical protein